MAIIRYYDPFRELAEMQRQFDQLFNQLSRPSAQPSLATPVADVYTATDKGKENLVVEAHLPNFKKEEIDVDVHEGALEIRAEHKAKEEEKKQPRYMLRESSSSFFRRVGLPKNVDANKVKAEFSDGALKVSVPFRALPKPKKITIGSKAAKK